ncbi:MULTISPECIES: hypothetical protein [unclassified Streptomyces]|uniref:hypothetical protein n=1 Tax=unclassified Streptomyces TaxID=2593676 RepID=UPI00224FDAD2|nr:hypothetical protein [Streptomyces sp. NBC_00047]MCX5612625.1 hypothetical protein [Streptomyces sp. NBC_00047]
MPVVRGLTADYRLYTARLALTDPQPTRRRQPTAAPDPDQPPPASPGDRDALQLPLEAGEWDIPSVPLRYDRAVIATTMLAAQLRTARAMYDVTAHQQAAMPEQLLVPFPEANSEADRLDDEPQTSRRRASAWRRCGPCRSPAPTWSSCVTSRTPSPRWSIEAARSRSDTPTRRVPYRIRCVRATSGPAVPYVPARPQAERPATEWLCQRVGRGDPP